MSFVAEQKNLNPAEIKFRANDIGLERSNITLQDLSKIRETRQSVSKAGIKEFTQSKGRSQEMILRDLLPSRWLAFENPQAARQADQKFLQDIRDSGKIDIVDTMAKLEAMRYAEKVSEIPFGDELVALTAMTVVSRQVAESTLARTRKVMYEDILGTTPERFAAAMTTDDTSKKYFLSFTNNLSKENTPYVVLSEAGVDVNKFIDGIEKLENGPLKSNISNRLKTDIAENGASAKFYLTEQKAIRDAIIDNAVPTGQRRSKRLENIPQTLFETIDYSLRNISKDQGFFAWAS